MVLMMMMKPTVFSTYVPQGAPERRFRIGTMSRRAQLPWTTASTWVVDEKDAKNNEALLVAMAHDAIAQPLAG
jgi:hypothetical protein